jgi:hypothetical protein
MVVRPSKKSFASPRAYHRMDMSLDAYQLILQTVGQKTLWAFSTVWLSDRLEGLPLTGTTDGSLLVVQRKEKGDGQERCQARSYRSSRST